MADESIKSESLRKALIKSMRRLDKCVRPSGLEVDQDWLLVIGLLTMSGYLKPDDQTAILKR